MPKFKTKSAFWLGAVALVFLLGWYFWYLWGPGGAPPGQPPLTSLSRQNLQQWTSDFDRASDDARLVLLLSPT